MHTGVELPHPTPHPPPHHSSRHSPPHKHPLRSRLRKLPKRISRLHMHPPPADAATPPNIPKRIHGRYLHIRHLRDPPLLTRRRHLHTVVAALTRLLKRLCWRRRIRHLTRKIRIPRRHPPRPLRQRDALIGG